jgi:ADP-heptose:LPS heptosyltransferase
MNRNLWKADKWSPLEWTKAMEVFGKARREKYDYGLDLHGHFKTALCLRISKPRKRLALRATDKFASILNPIYAVPQCGRHFVDWALSALSVFTDSTADTSPIMPNLLEESESTKRWVHDTKPTISIATTTSKLDTKYPIERWKAVGKELADRGFSIVFLGGKDGVACELPGTTDLVGKLSLSESMAIVAKSSLHLAADTGMGHIAAAYGIPVISVFGPTNPNLIRPYTNKGTVLQSTKDVLSIQPEQVIEEALNLYKRHGK